MDKNKNNEDELCQEHCGCGVPFTEDCDTCREFLGDEYHSPNEKPCVPISPEL